MQQIYKTTPMLKCDLLKSHFGMGVLLQICWIFSQHLFLKTPLEGYFCDIFCYCILSRADACSSCSSILCVEIEMLEEILCTTLSPFYRKYTKKNLICNGRKAFSCSRSVELYIISALKNLVKFSGIHLRQRHDKCLHSRCFLPNFAKFFRTVFYGTPSENYLTKMSSHQVIKFMSDLFILLNNLYWIFFTRP